MVYGHPKTSGDLRDGILIADDDPLICSFISHCLTEVGCHTLTANDAIKTIDLAAHRRLKCIILDCHFGAYERGLELIRPLRLLAPTAPIVMISADTHWALAADALKRGAFVFWRKTDGYMDLIQAVSVAMQEHEHLAAGGEAIDLDELEREAILEHLSARHGNLSCTAREVDQHVDPVSVLMKKHGIPQWR